MQDNLALSKLDCYNREQRGSLYINMERALDHTVQLKKKTCGAEQYTQYAICYVCRIRTYIYMHIEIIETKKMKKVVTYKNDDKQMDGDRGG